MNRRGAPEPTSNLRRILEGACSDEKKVNDAFVAIMHAVGDYCSARVTVIVKSGKRRGD